MALAILDGTQTATTLSTILSSGQHITAHTVVSLGTQAITDILNATSAGLTNTQLRASAVTIGGTVTVGNSLTISSLPAISGTVTANLALGGYPNAVQLVSYDDESLDYFAVAVNSADGPYIPTRIVGGTVTVGSALPAGTNRIGVVTIGAGTVTIGAGTAQIGSVTASISGTVTANAGANFSGEIYTGIFNFSENAQMGVYVTDPLPTGTNRIGVVTIGAGTVTIGAGTAQIGSVTASFAISSTAITSGSFSSLTSATLVPGNTTRKMATVYNLGAGQLFVNAGATATTLGGGFMVALSSGDFYECNYTTTTLSAIFATAGTASWVSH